MRHSMMIDLEKCVGCMACVSSCKQRWGTGPGAARDWVHTFEHGTRGKDLSLTFYPGLCMQCEQHPCTLDCPTGATFVNAQGVVVVDPDVCIGCGNCISGCAYGARHADPVKKIVEKCNLCEPYVARGQEPACVATCLAQCRVFGDLDDPTGELSQQIRERDARPLKSAEVDIGPKVTYAGAFQRERILAAGVLTPPKRSALTRIWEDGSRPFARYLVPSFVGGVFASGVFINLLARRQRMKHPQEPAVETGPGIAAPSTAAAPLLRHRAGMRLLHWFNALSWILLLATGTALMSAKSFALFGEGFPRWLASFFGGAAPLLRFHAVWGLLWALVIVPLFLLYKQGGREALEEIRLRSGDLRWLLLKPLAMLGLAKQPLPPQDKYNAGQKIFAVTAIVGTSTIIATGLVMIFHLGSPPLVAAAILVHKLAIAFAMLGLSVHLMMAVILREERAALRSMIVGTIDRHHALAHNARWVEEHDKQSKPGSHP
ncbi:MAG: cytochrome b/b6 domain-containing protein [Deltaproteobacteria bacterium]|nr:cytochrome b/b6 domain-containing protein [Deltaproteobacteria bacterium]